MAKSLSSFAGAPAFEKTETYKNLMKAMEGEASACMKYTIYASLIGKTSKELEKKILEIAHNEKEHWKVYAKLALRSKYYDDEMNIKDAILGETNEHLNLYPNYAKVAFDEGYEKIGNKFLGIAEIEGQHMKEFKEILNQFLSENTQEEKQWICLNCGHIHKGIIPPEECPICEHPKNYFMKID